MISAANGVACYQWLPSNGIAEDASVGLAIGAMYYTRCIHPPGGATSLAAEIGGPNAHALGYQYILTPIAIKTAAIFLAAFLFNHLFHWRLYSRLLLSIEFGKDYNKVGYEPVDHADFIYVLGQIDTFIDITKNELLKFIILPLE